MKKPTVKGSVSQGKSLLIGVAGSILGAGLGRVHRLAKIGGVVATGLAAQMTGRKELTGLAVGMALSPPAIVDDVSGMYSGGIEGIKERVADAVDGMRDQAASVLRDFYVPDSVTSAISAGGVSGIFSGDDDLDFLYEELDDEEIAGILPEAVISSSPAGAELNQFRTPEAMILSQMNAGV